MRDLKRVRSLHTAADKLEPGMYRVALAGLRKIRQLADPSAIATAVAHGNPFAALAAITDAEMAEAMAPVAEMSKRVFLHGGQVGAPQVRASKLKKVRGK